MPSKAISLSKFVKYFSFNAFNNTCFCSLCQPVDIKFFKKLWELTQSPQSLAKVDFIQHLFPTNLIESQVGKRHCFTGMVEQAHY